MLTVGNDRHVTDVGRIVHETTDLVIALVDHDFKQDLFMCSHTSSTVKLYKVSHLIRKIASRYLLDHDGGCANIICLSGRCCLASCPIRPTLRFEDEAVAPGRLDDCPVYMMSFDSMMVSNAYTHTGRSVAQCFDRRVIGGPRIFTKWHVLLKARDSAYLISLVAT